MHLRGIVCVLCFVLLELLQPREGRLAARAPEALLVVRLVHLAAQERVKTSATKTPSESKGFCECRKLVVSV